MNKVLTIISFVLSVSANVALSVALIDSRNQLKIAELNYGTYEAIISDCQNTIEELRNTKTDIGLLQSDPSDIGTLEDAPEVEEDKVF